MNCERIVSGFLGQPTNAISNLAFLIAAAWLLILALRGERATRVAMLVLALVVGANAVGSFARDGPDPSWARWAHFAAIMAALLFIAVHALGRMRGWRPTVEIGVFAFGLAAVGIGLAAIHGASDPFPEPSLPARSSPSGMCWRPSHSWHARTHSPSRVLGPGARPSACSPSR